MAKKPSVKVRRLTPHQKKLVWHRAMELYMDGLSAQEVADHKDIPYTVYAVRRHAQKEGWMEKRKALTGTKRKRKQNKDAYESASQQLAEAHEKETIELLKERDNMWMNWTPRTKDVVLNMVKTGKPLKTAMQMFGFNAPAVNKLMDLEPEFKNEVQAAIREYETFLIDQMVKHSVRNWQATAYLMEHHPDLKNDYVDKKDGGGVNITLTFERKPVDTFEIVDIAPEEIEKVNPEDVKELPQSPPIEIVKPKPASREDILQKARARVEEFNKNLREKSKIEKERYGHRAEDTEGA